MAPPSPSADLALLRTHLRPYPDFPRPGVLFLDIFPLFADASAHAQLLGALEQLIRTKEPALRPDVICGLESRAFLFAPGLALRLGIPFVPLRKPGKLPGATMHEAFTKEYGPDGWELAEGAVGAGQRVLVLDDVLATGGSAAAAGRLVARAGAVVAGYVFMIEVEGLGGRERLGEGVDARVLL